MKAVESSGSDAVISGVPLAQYAAVTAALGAAFPLKAVLAVEGLDATAWAKADRGWTARLADDAALMARYETEIAAAEDRLSRTVEPIDTDLKAWVAFASALARAREPGELLKRHGIGSDDVSRLQRRWAARMKEDPSLAERSAELRKSSDGTIPPLRVVKAKLTRSGTGLAAPAATSSAPTLPERVAPAPAPAPPPPAPAPVAHELAETRPPSAEGTSIAFPVPKTFLPFHATPSPEFQEALNRPAAAPGEGSDGETVAIHVSAARRARAPLPFAGEAASPPTPSEDEPPPSSRPAAGRTVKMKVARHPAAPAPQEAARRRPPTESGPPGATIAGMLSPFARKKPLPFDDADDSEPTRAFEPRSLKKLVEVPPLDEEPPMALETHASLCLELAVNPARADDTLARYKISAVDKERADQFYRTRLDADPELRAQWNRAFELYRAWFTARQGH